MGLGDELLEDAHYLADKGVADQRKSYMRRAISTAYYAVFHLFVEDFVEHWEFPDQRATGPHVQSRADAKCCVYAEGQEKPNPA